VKLDQAQGELSTLENQKATVIGTFLKDQAEAIAGEYIEQAEKLIEAFIKLRALDNLIQKNGTPVPITGAYHNGELNIPVFALDAFNGKEHTNWPSCLTKAVSVKNATWDMDLMTKTAESLQADFAAQGIII